MGDDVKAALGLDDAVLDIEVEPNRPDFLSVFGVAREVSAATGVPLIEPDHRSEETREDGVIDRHRADRGRRGLSRVRRPIIRGVDATGRAPLRVQARLTAAGMRPVSAVVDATNYTMLELGQPLHAFDMDRLAGPGIVVRHAAKGSGSSRSTTSSARSTHDDLLICDLERPVAIGGVMGGATSEVSETTTTGAPRERLLHPHRGAAQSPAGWTCTAKPRIGSNAAPTPKGSSGPPPDAPG